MVKPKYYHIYQTNGQCNSAIHKRTTRYCNDLRFPKCRLATGQRMFSNRGAKLYNDLPRELRMNSFA